MITRCPSHLPKSLEILNLSANNITHISRNDLKGLSALKQLRFDHNSIVSIEEDSFLDLNLLSILNLSYNKLHRIQSSEVINTFGNLQFSKTFIFTGFKNLANLDLSHNDIEGWLKDTFTNVTLTITTLDLSFNHITNISTIPVEDNYLPKNFYLLKEVYLENNKWNCSCMEVKWLVDHQNILMNAEKILCQYPNNLKGKELFSITDLKNCSKKYNPLVPPNYVSNRNLYWIIPVCIILGIIFAMFISRKPKKCVQLFRNWRRRRYTPLCNQNQNIVEPVWMVNIRSTKPDNNEDVVLLSRENAITNDNIKVLDNLISFDSKVMAYYCRILIVDYPPFDEEILKCIIKERSKDMFDDEQCKVTYIFHSSDLEFTRDSEIFSLVENLNVQEYTDIINQIYNVL